ncbi:hypothetical protein BT63DRAFT_188276 [Microthyrium microscopicum]|uniref:Uncharacterized protein n=1 Tax=Microthyrium microscopicum TaxID=703497 RepID=A0A6A6UKX7_9PEZI|nr:hypothetical protein BT63DRAFT_188276 [Microthyrium microscopicum]
MIIPDHWFVRGVQSALFYYVSCGPCSNAKYMRKRKKAAERDRKAMEVAAEKDPNLYLHPGPSEMNAYWREEMLMGPSSTAKRPRKNTKDSQCRPGTNRTSVASVGSGGSISQVDGVREPGEAHSGTGKRRYRRAAEEFEWIDEKVEDDGEFGSGWKQRSYKIPPVNDMHPAIVSMIPARPEDRRWMKAPPPSVAFMNGQKGVTVIDNTSKSRGPSVEKQGSRTSIPGTLDHGLRVPTPSSRPVSAGKRAKQRANALHLQLTSESEDDTDYEYDGPSPSRIARPRATYRSTSRASNRKSVHRPHLSTIASQDTASGRPSPKLSPQLPSTQTMNRNSENLSPRVSPRSVSSVPSPNSSDEEALPSPRLRPLRSKANTTSGLNPLTSAPSRNAHLEKLQIPTSRPLDGLKHSHSHSGRERISNFNNDSAIMLNAEEDATDGALYHDSNGSVDMGSIDISALIKGLSEKTAREQMWLGPAPLRSERGNMEKRWSTEF